MSFISCSRISKLAMYGVVAGAVALAPAFAQNGSAYQGRTSPYAAPVQNTTPRPNYNGAPDPNRENVPAANSNPYGSPATANSPYANGVNNAVSSPVPNTVNNNPAPNYDGRTDHNFGWIGLLGLAGLSGLLRRSPRNDRTDYDRTDYDRADYDANEQTRPPR